MKRVLKEQSPQTILDPIKTRILLHKDLSETVESVEDMCLHHLLWLNEQIEIHSQLQQALHEDEERIRKMNESKPGV